MSVASAQDLRWLDAAARFASPFLGMTADNPAVGAIIVDPATQTLVARAVTARSGRPHAEALAIEEAGDAARGKTLYVTLEPCHHWGRTPPCVDAVIRAGIARVIIGSADADPRTAGAGLKRLANAGIETILIDHEPSRRLHEGHFKRQTEGRPFVTLKLAVSADGMIGRRDEGKVAMIGDMARHWLHMQRARADAVLIGGRTAAIDDPQLTVRLPGLEQRTPLRIILAGRQGVDRRLGMIDGFTGHRVAVIAHEHAPIDVPASIEVTRISGDEGRPDLGLALKALGGKGLQNLIVEAGQGLSGAFLASGMVDRFALLRSEAVIGEVGLPATPEGPIEDRLEASGLVEAERQALGRDLLTIYERRPA